MGKVQTKNNTFPLSCNKYFLAEHLTSGCVSKPANLISSVKDHGYLIVNGRKMLITPVN